MSGPKHSKQTIADGIHTALAYTYANAATRLAATGFIADDLGKFAWQTDNDSFWVLTATTPTWAPIGGAPTSLFHKAGNVAAGSFSGNPKTFVVNFSTAFGDADYGVTISCVTTNDTSFAPIVENQTAASFGINMSANNITDLVQVNWVALKTGESS